jgi:DNA-binding response OmpR family regulator
MSQARSPAYSLPPADGDTPIEVAFVGDDPALADLYRLKLEVDGYAVTLFTTAQGSAGQRLGHPDIVYLDTGFLSVAGLAAHRRLRAHRGTERVPIVLLSNRLAMQELAERLEFGVHDFLVPSDGVRPDAFWDEFAAARRRSAETLI